MFDTSNTRFKLIPYLSTGTNLFDQFLILGYSNDEKAKDIQRQITALSEKNEEYSVNIKDSSQLNQFSSLPSSSGFKPVISNIRPTVINSITCKYNSHNLIDSSNVLRFIYPNNPKFYYAKNELGITKESYPSSYNVCFFLSNDMPNATAKNISYGFSHIYYELIRLPSLGIIFIPKAICILSKYPYFAHYLSLIKDILKFASSTSIPIEMIISNIINYTPAPIESQLNYSFFPEAFYTNKTYSLERMSIEKMSGYPILDLHFAEIFNVLPLEMIIKLFIFSFLEIEMLLFSSRIEMLNFFMFTLSSLNYPCNDTMYLWHIISVSKSDLMNRQSDNRFVSKPFPSILGVNQSYDDHIDLSRYDKGIFIADLDNKKFFYREGCDSKDVEDDLNQLRDLINHISDIINLKDMPIENNFDLNIKMLYSRLLTIASKEIKQNQNREKAFIPNFFQVNQMITNQNRLIQEIFYSFIANAIRPLYLQHSQLKHNKESDASLSLNDLKEYNPIEEESNTMAFASPKEKIFYEFFGFTCKYSYYILSFFHDYEAVDCFQIPLLFFEEFLNNNNQCNVEGEYDIKHLDIIDSFYKTGIYNTMNTNVTICNYDRMIKKSTKRGLLLYSDHYIPLINPISAQLELDKVLMYKYCNIVSNIESTDELKVFPSLRQLQSKKLSSVFQSEIIDCIQSHYITAQLISTKDLLSYSTVLFSTLVSDLLKPNEFIDSLKVIFELLLRQAYFTRKYITTLLSVYYKKAIQLKESNQEYYHYVFAYQLMLKLITLKHICPHSQLMQLIIQFRAIDHNSIDIQCAHSQFRDLFSPDKTKPNSISLNSTKTTQFDSSFAKTFDIYDMSHLSSGTLRMSTSSELSYLTEYKLFLIKNQCRDESKKKELIYQLIEKDYGEGCLCIKCDKCKKTITPLIKYHYGQTNFNLEVNVLTPMKLFNSSTFMMLNWVLREMTANGLDLDLLRGMMVNLHFYQQLIHIRSPIAFAKGLCRI